MITKPIQLAPPCFNAPGKYGPKIANRIKKKHIKGKVKPIDLLAASKVNTISKDPIKISILVGLPTLDARISGGSRGKYKAVMIVSKKKIISR